MTSDHHASDDKFPGIGAPPMTTPSQSVVERVARAMLVADGQAGDHFLGDYIPLARAALTAMLDAAPGMIEAIKRARDLAMRMTVEARIPECGHFGAIAQDLDAALNEMLGGRDNG